MGKENEFIYSKKLKPGIYLGTRRVGRKDIPWLPNIFRHQFFTLIPKNPELFKGKLADFGGGNKGILIGGYMYPGEKILSRNLLVYKRNEIDDLDAIREYISINSGQKEKPFWSPVISRAIVPESKVDSTISNMLAAAENYQRNTKKEPIYYPRFIKNVSGKGINSNSFAQTLADVSGIEKRRRDFPGADYGADLRIPEKFFKESGFKVAGTREPKELRLIKRTKLEPGVYLGSRRVAINTGVGKSPIGRHQFFVLVPKDPSKFEGILKDFGETKAILVGAYNVKPSFFSKRRLRYHRNYGNDMKAFREFFSLQRGDKVSPFWETQISRSINQGKSTDDLISKILRAGENYRDRERENPVFYPSLVKNIFGRGKNSNTFVQSLADAVGIKKRREDFPGYDPGQNLRIEKSMFEKDL